jgi:hypothetical protein
MTETTTQTRAAMTHSGGKVHELIGREAWGVMDWEPRCGTRNNRGTAFYTVDAPVDCQTCIKRRDGR